MIHLYVSQVASEQVQASTDRTFKHLQVCHHLREGAKLSSFWLTPIGMDTTKASSVIESRYVLIWKGSEIARKLDWEVTVTSSQAAALVFFCSFVISRVPGRCEEALQRARAEFLWMRECRCLKKMFSHKIDTAALDAGKGTESVQGC